MLRLLLRLGRPLPLSLPPRLLCSRLSRPVSSAVRRVLRLELRPVQLRLSELLNVQPLFRI
jgi:hypothetical protein